MTDTKRKNITKKWIEEVVVAHNFCPFAHRELLADSIRYVCVSHEKALDELINECVHLDTFPETETTFLILKGDIDFSYFLYIIDVAQQILHLKGYEGVYQIATFHPEYCFEGNVENDASNFTNRSPFPMLHILRESSIDRVVKNTEAVEKIPGNNVQRCNELGRDYFKRLFYNILNDE